MRKKKATSKKPVCEKCHRSGTGVQFQIFGAHPFGKYCVECEEAIKTALVGAVQVIVISPQRESGS